MARERKGREGMEEGKEISKRKMEASEAREIMKRGKREAGRERRRAREYDKRE